jgi:ElaB/YqjD/DUF883 family membrane-anchored ribosome-binding protein
MKNRKNYIEKNRIVFDDQEPEEGHLERFEEKLNRYSAENKDKSVKIKWIHAFAIAASVALLLGVGIRYYSAPVKVEQNPENEFFTTDNFYKRQMDSQIANIQCKLEKADTKTRKQLEDDLQSLIEENNRFVEKIQNDENEELALFYMVKHYKANLQALRFINNKLENYIEC